VPYLFRLLVGLLFYRFARARRTGKPVVDMAAVRGRVNAVREPVSIAGRVVAALALAAVSLALLAAGVSGLVLTTLTWLGGLALGLAAVFALAAVPEVVSVRRTVRARRRRLHEQELQRELDSSRSP